MPITLAATTGSEVEMVGEWESTSRINDNSSINTNTNANTKAEGCAINNTIGTATTNSFVVVKPIETQNVALQNAALMPVYSLAPLVKLTQPKVVVIYGLCPQQENKTFIEDFFASITKVEHDCTPGDAYQVGSGLIIDNARGYIVTNHHVVNHLQQIMVVLYDHRKANAKIIRVDAKNDLVLLQIVLDRLDELDGFDLSNQAIVEVGDFVMAVGAPSKIGRSVTFGIVNAIHQAKHIANDNSHAHIQFDASIYHGSSGGALVNMKGELIGITSAKYTHTNIGIAIPISAIKKLVNSEGAH